MSTRLDGLTRMPAAPLGDRATRDPGERSRSTPASIAHRTSRVGRFVSLWTLAVFATASAFVLYLALRSRAVELGYKLGRARQRQAQLRETRRVLQVEAVAHRNPERIDALAKGVLQMEEPPPQRIFVLGAPIEPTEAPAPKPSTNATFTASSPPFAPSPVAAPSAIHAPFPAANVGVIP